MSVNFSIKVRALIMQRIFMKMTTMGMMNTMISQLKNPEEYLITKKIKLDTLRALKLNIKLRSARIGNSQAFVLLRKAALSPMVSMNSIQSKIFPRTTRQSFVEDSMRSYIVLTVQDANSNTKVTTSLTRTIITT